MITTSLVKSASPALKLTCSAAHYAAFSALTVPAARGTLLHGTLAKQPTVASCRNISTSSILYNDAMSKRSPLDVPPMHRVPPDIRNQDVGTIPAQKVPDKIQGDWVLFHPVYSPEELKAVEVLHHKEKTMGDTFARALVSFARRTFDFVLGYKHPDKPPSPDMTLDQLRKAGYVLSEKQWLDRILFLESIAGCPGMVAATLRHLQSLRLMRHDSGWIHTLLEEAENERMHLMSFMTLRKTTPFYRLMILGAQGIFYNLFFISYLISPKICHRFVGYLEEEAVITYTRCISDLEAGKIPEWTNEPAPEIAINYWRLPKDAKLLDMIYAVRSDETTHRFVNHSLANLDPSTDVNPFAIREPDMLVKGKKIEFARSESEEYVKQSHELLSEIKQQGKEENA
ncbi:alternative oxidase [Pholiota molesta]|nr:alternative oxidase [Pholiota molesta]